MNHPTFHVEHTKLQHLDSCPICGGAALKKVGDATDHTVSKATFELHDCARCGFRMTNPRPGPNSIGAFYISEEYISHTNSDKGLQNKLYQAVRKRALASKYKLIHKEHPNGQVLDVGCGTGEFLAYLTSRGHLVQGVEPDVSAREQAIANHSLSVLPALAQVPAREQFQVVTLWHVLEHLHDLRQTMKRLYALLENEGTLIIAVPDRESYDASTYGFQWAAYDVPRHLWHFRRKDITRLLHEHGFDLVATKGMWFDSTYVSLLSERHLGKPEWLAWPKALFRGLSSNISSMLSDRPTSSTLYIARKTPA